MLVLVLVIVLGAIRAILVKAFGHARDRTRLLFSAVNRARGGVFVVFRDADIEIEPSLVIIVVEVLTTAHTPITSPVVDFLASTTRLVHVVPVEGDLF